MRTTLMHKEQHFVSVLASQVPRVVRFLFSVGFSETANVEGAPANARSFACNDCLLHLSEAASPDTEQSAIAISLQVADAEAVAAACWTDGYTIEVREQPGEETRLTIAGPSGLLIRLGMPHNSLEAAKAAR